MSLAAPLIDIDALVARLDEHPGSGPDLRFDPAYKMIADARRDENTRLPQGVWAREVKHANWPLVERLCADLLRTRSKDLLVACWLAEAVVYRNGFAGLAPGVRLLTGLCRHFWADLHPAIEDDDLAPRVAPFEWLNTRFPRLLRNLPVVRSAANPEVAYTWTDYVNAQLLEGLRQRDLKSVERSEAAGAITMAAFTATRQATETRFWQETISSLRAVTDALAELNATLEELCGSEAPGLGGIADAIKDILNLTATALSERRPPPPAPSAPFVPAAASLPPVPARQPAPPRTITTRQDAYAQLAEISRLLHRIEPHSPVPYLIDRAVKWGDMSFGNLVMTFSEAGMDFAAVFDLLGLAEADPASDGFEKDDLPD
jgi:type VI secretion system ImpA family protein